MTHAGAVKAQQDEMKQLREQMSKEVGGIDGSLKANQTALVIAMKRMGNSVEQSFNLMQKCSADTHMSGKAITEIAKILEADRHRRLMDDTKCAFTVLLWCFFKVLIDAGHFIVHSSRGDAACSQPVAHVRFSFVCSAEPVVDKTIS